MGRNWKSYLKKYLFEKEWRGVCLMDVIALVTALSGLCLTLWMGAARAGLAESNFLSPVMTLSEMDAEERAELLLAEERAALESRLPVDATAVKCFPSKTDPNLMCLIKTGGFFGAWRPIAFPRVAGVPAVGFSYDAAIVSSSEALQFKGPLSHEQRLRLFKAFPTPAK